MSELPGVASTSRRTWMWLLAWAAATSCVFIFARKFDLHAIFLEIRRANVGWVLLSMLGFFLLLPILTEQWVRLAPKSAQVRWSTMWESVTISLAAMNVLPFGGGHALATGLLARRVGLGLERAVSLLAVEQLCESMVKAGLLLLVLVVTPVPPEWRAAAWTVAGVLLASSVFFWMLAQRPASASPSGSWRYRLTQHAAPLREPRVLLVALGLGLGTKLVDLIGIYAVQRSLGVTLPVSTLPFLLMAVSVATLISVSPGSLGVYEAAAFAAYRWLGVPTEQALALAIVQHFCYLVPMVGTGYAITLLRAVRSRQER